MPTAEQLDIARQNIANYKKLAEEIGALAKLNETWAQQMEAAGNTDYAGVYKKEGEKYRKAAKWYEDKAKKFEDIVEKDTTVEEDPVADPNGGRRKSRKGKGRKSRKAKKGTRRH